MNEINTRSRLGWMAAPVVGLLAVVGLLVLLAFPVTAAPSSAILAYTSFEEPGTGSEYVDTGDPATDHPLVNNPGEAPVNYTSAGGELGFSSYYYNTRNGDGLTDGDFVGVTDFTGVVGSYPDGTQGFQISDPDGKMTVSLDEVDLSAAIAPSISISYFLEETGWESNDVFRAWVSVNGGELDLINTAGSDIDDLGIEGAWQAASLNLTGYPTATLHFELDANSGYEAVYVDNILFTEAEADLTVSKSGPGFSSAGSVAVYDVTVINSGGLSATNVIVTDTLPISTTFVADNIGGGVEVAPGVYTWSLGTVLSQTSQTYQITLTIDAGAAVGTMLTNTVDVATDTPSDDPGDNSDTAVTEILPPFATTDAFSIEELGRFAAGSGAEISAYDPVSQTLYVVTGGDFMEILDIGDPFNPALLDTIAISPTYGAGANSVDVYDGVVAVAVENVDGAQPGSVVFFDRAGNYLNDVTAGVLPDMLTYSHDGDMVLVANEGEPNDDYTVDPEGSVTIVDMSGGVGGASATQLGFTHFTTATIDPAVRIFGPGASVAQDVEPEYITLSADDSMAWVSLQENNAVAIVDTAAMTITDIVPLGFKDHSLAENALDPSNRDGGVNIAAWPVWGMYQPDAISSYEVDGVTYLLTANEGDARDYTGYSEEARIADLTLDPSFPNSATLQLDENLGRLKTTLANGDVDNDGDFEELYAYGARSFSIWNGESGALVYDSGSDLEELTALFVPDFFNANDGDEAEFDNRSDDKGPEPEGMAKGMINGRTYAFIGLERTGGVVIYDVTDPATPAFAYYIAPEDTDNDGIQENVAPEGLLFIDGEDSPTGYPLLVVNYEVSNSTVIYQFTFDADVSVAKSGPEYGVIDNEIVYTVEISNNTSAVASDLVFTDTLSAGLTYVADDSGVTPDNPDAGVYVWDLGDVPPGFSLTVQITATVDAGLTAGALVTNTAEISAGGMGDDPADNEEAVESEVYPLVSIYEVQTVTDPANDDASPLEGQTVWVEGIVTSEPGDIDDPTNLMVIQDPAGGPWSGLALYRDSGFASYPPGTQVRALGAVDEFFGYTELQMSDSPWAIEVMGATAVPTPEPLNTADYDESDPAVSEQWESVLIEFQNATVTDDDLGFGEWAFDDGSGPARADDIGEEDGDLTYLPTNGDVYQFIRGIGYYSFGNYKLAPRSDADIGLLETAPVIEKTAPEVVDPGQNFTYTISVENYLGVALTNLVITDVIPSNASLVSVLDGGVESGGVITWNIPSLPDQASAEVRFVVSAAAAGGDLIVNDLYGVTADNYVTPTLGLPVSTSVFGFFAIPDIQGADFTSPYEERILATNGVVIGFFEGNYPGSGGFDGFFIQDTAGGDGDAGTSDGIFINHGVLDVPVSIGDVVTVTGKVQEFNEYDGSFCFESDGCLTQIAVSDANDVEIGVSVSLPAPVEIDPPAGDSAVGDVYYESLEGMLATMPVTGVVVGPTSFNTIDVIRSDMGVERALRGTDYESMPVGLRHYERYGEIGGGDAPSLITGSTVDSFTGPLGFSYGRYLAVTQEGAPWTVLTEATPPAAEPTWPAPLADEFSVATFNTLNFDGGDDAAKLDKVIRSIDRMNGPTFLALQEIAVDEVITDVLDALSGLGYSYDYAYSHPDVGGHGVAMLWRNDLVDSAAWSTDYQGCSAYGSGSSVAYDDYCEGTDLLPLFSRRPVVVTATLTLDGEQETVIVIGNHFKSKIGGAPSDQRRLEQAQFVADLVDGFVADSTPYVLVMGDLNDFEDAPPLQALYASGNLTTTWNMAPAETRYSYIFQGVSQILDHILVSPALWRWTQDVAPLHANADFPYAFSEDGTVMWRVSDHDLVAATFAQTDYYLYMPVIANP